MGETDYALPSTVYNFFGTEERNVFNNAIEAINANFKKDIGQQLIGLVSRWMEQEDERIKNYGNIAMKIKFHHIPPYTKQKLNLYMDSFFAMVLAGYDFINVDAISNNHFILLEKIALKIAVLKARLKLGYDIDTAEVDTILIKILLFTQTCINKMAASEKSETEITDLRRITRICFNSLKTYETPYYDDFLAKQYELFASEVRHDCLGIKLNELSQFHYKEFSRLAEGKHNVIIPFSSNSVSGEYRLRKRKSANDKKTQLLEKAAIKGTSPMSLIEGSGFVSFFGQSSIKFQNQFIQFQGEFYNGNISVSKNSTLKASGEWDNPHISISHDSNANLDGKFFNAEINVSGDSTLKASGTWQNSRIGISRNSQAKFAGEIYGGTLNVSENSALIISGILENVSVSIAYYSKITLEKGEIRNSSISLGQNSVFWLESSPKNTRIDTTSDTAIGVEVLEGCGFFRNIKHQDRAGLAEIEDETENNTPIVVTCIPAP